MSQLSAALYLILLTLLTLSNPFHCKCFLCSNVCRKDLVAFFELFSARNLNLAWCTRRGCSSSSSALDRGCFGVERKRCFERRLLRIDRSELVENSVRGFAGFWFVRFRLRKASVCFGEVNVRGSFVSSLAAATRGNSALGKAGQGMRTQL